MLDKYQELCEYVSRLYAENQDKLETARAKHDVYGHKYFDLLNSNEILLEIKLKMGEINERQNF